MEGLSPLHLVIVLVIAVLVLGPGKLPEVGEALGKTLREFRRATSDIAESARLDAAPAPAPAVASAPAAAPSPDPAEIARDAVRDGSGGAWRPTKSGSGGDAP